MTERQAFDVGEAKELAFHRCGWRCEVCGRPLLDGQPQLAHRIPQSKAMLKMFGPHVIHHQLNMAAVCSLKCNAAVSIRQPGDMQALADRIAEYDRK